MPNNSALSTSTVYNRFICSPSAFSKAAWVWYYSLPRNQTVLSPSSDYFPMSPSHSFHSVNSFQTTWCLNQSVVVEWGWTRAKQWRKSLASCSDMMRLITQTTAAFFCCCCCWNAQKNIRHHLRIKQMALEVHLFLFLSIMKQLSLNLLKLLQVRCVLPVYLLHLSAEFSLEVVLSRWWWETSD